MIFWNVFVYVPPKKCVWWLIHEIFISLCDEPLHEFYRPNLVVKSSKMVELIDKAQKRTFNNFESLGVDGGPHRVRG